MNRLPDDGETFAGKLGAMWVYGPKQYYVLLVHSRLYNQNFPDRLSRGDEHGFVCDPIEARVWLDRLQVPASKTFQARFLAAHTRGEV